MRADARGNFEASFRLLPALLCGLLLVVPTGGQAGDTGKLEELTTAEQVRQLTPDQAALHYPVKIRGVLTFFDPAQFFRFVQDDTAGIYLFPADALNDPALATGQLVEIQGESSPGEYAPTITPQKIRILGTGVFPAAKAVSYEALTSGGEDSQFVEIHGVVCSVTYDPQTRYNSVEIATGSGRLTALISQLPVTNKDSLVDSTVDVRGVCSTRFNRQRQLFDLRLLLPRPEDIVIESPALADPFAIPVHPISQLLQFSPNGPHGHRVKVAGTVIYRREGTMYIQDSQEGLYVETRQSEPSLLLGDQVEALGFPARGEYTPMLKDAIYRRTGPGPLPEPIPVTARDALNGSYDCRLVRLDATVVDRARQSPDEFLVLQSGGIIFHAYLERKTSGVDFSYLENGSKVALTGVCRIELGGEWQAGTEWRAKSFNLLLRSPGDITVLARPPWWNVRRMLWAAGALAAVLLTALAWVVVLRRRVQQQTAVIRRQLQTEATLKERYENLFENADDMVFTNDLQGRITSINESGERMLQRGRGEIVGRNLVDFVAGEQRDAVRQWLERVAREQDAKATEWDFRNAAGQRVKLEISSRLIKQDHQGVEIEGIARDITERRRLERELLDISNREQRRIGHDLHDGICQRLAAIAYIADVLGDQLQEKKQPEAAEAERIGTLINEVNTQARNVARGLFPARLDESGLNLALEELAVGAAGRYGITCRFDCHIPVVRLDEDMELHLYYIAQEALMNAINHGKASSVVLTLGADADLMRLTIQDNGKGFNPGARGRSGMGLRIMEYRAKAIGATLHVGSEAGRGTRIGCAFVPSYRENAKETT